MFSDINAMKNAGAQLMAMANKLGDLINLLGTFMTTEELTDLKAALDYIDAASLQAYGHAHRAEREQR